MDASTLRRAAEIAERLADNGADAYDVAAELSNLADEYAYDWNGAHRAPVVIPNVVSDDV